MRDEKGEIHMFTSTRKNPRLADFDVVTEQPSRVRRPSTEGMDERSSRETERLGPIPRPYADSE